MAGTTWLKSEIDQHGGVTKLARHLAVSTTAVEHWYTGRNHPSDQHAGELAEWLGIPEAVLRQRLGMATFGNEDAGRIYAAGGRRVLEVLLVAANEALNELDADEARGLRQSS